MTLVGKVDIKRTTLRAKTNLGKKLNSSELVKSFVPRWNALEP
jgi:hypothetical protein